MSLFLLSFLWDALPTPCDNAFDSGSTQPFNLAESIKRFGEAVKSFDTDEAIATLAELSRPINSEEAFARLTEASTPRDHSAAMARMKELEEGTKRWNNL